MKYIHMHLFLDSLSSILGLSNISLQLDINMSVPPANTSLNLTPHAHQRCCDLFTCCLPTKGESEEDENEGRI